MLQQGYGNNLFRRFGYINGELQPTGYWDTIGPDPSPSLYLRLEFPNWGTAANNGTLQSTTIYAGTATSWPDLPSVTQRFSFDSLNRLASASEDSDWSQSYNYDQYGNMWMPSSTLPAPALGPVAPTTNVYSASNNRNVYSSYDASGNLAAFGAIGLSYDAENRQTAAGVNSYLYDGAGRRVSKTTGGGRTAFVYDAFGQLAAEYAGGTVWTKDYIRHGGQIVAIENASGSPCTTCYLSRDFLGTVRMVTDQYANIIARHDYAPFGQEIQSGVGPRTSLWGASDNVNQKFTGQERDGETNLDFFQARYLSSGIGRFNSPDPGNAGADLTNPQSWNGYAYVGGNPLNAVDPSGRSIVDCAIDACGSPFGPAAGAGAVAGGGVGGVILDGVEQTVFNSSGLGSEGVAQCPNNACSGFGTNLEGQTSYVQFTASAGSGPQGYRSIPEMGTYNYDIGTGQYLNAGQFNQAIQSAVNAQQVALAAAISKLTGLDYSKVYGVLSTQPSADGITMVTGGNVQFTIGADPGDYPDLAAYIYAQLQKAGLNDRTFGAPSIHLHGPDPFGPYHLDTMSPYSGFGWGLLVHFGVDVFGGTVFYGPIPLPRP